MSKTEAIGSSARSALEAKRLLSTAHLWGRAGSVGVGREVFGWYAGIARSADLMQGRERNCRPVELMEDSVRKTKERRYGIDVRQACVRYRY